MKKILTILGAFVTGGLTVLFMATIDATNAMISQN